MYPLLPAFSLPAASFYAQVIKKDVFGGETKNFTRFYVLYKALSTENVENSVESVEKGLAA